MTKHTHLIAYLRTLADEVDSKLMANITVVEDELDLCVEDLVWMRKSLLALAKDLEEGDLLESHKQDHPAPFSTVRKVV